MDNAWAPVEAKNEEIYRRMHYMVKSVKREHIKSDSEEYKNGYMDAITDVLDSLKDVYEVKPFCDEK
jgi:hypothetical protein